MRFLRRGSADEADTAEPETDAVSVPSRPGHTAGKGRPTPKRRDAEGKRRGPMPPPPKTQRESMRLAKQNRAARAERRKESAERRGRMMAGDQSALLAKDRGPVKAFVRDVVDAHRHVIGLFMPLAGLVMVSLVLPIPQIAGYFRFVSMALIVAMVLEGVLLGRQVNKQVRERFPKEQVSTFGLGWYAFSRASQLRRLRIPKPRVRIGDTV